ncbi:MAG: hypothetical protein JW720_13095 [Sedimentisphaerales bacterium]|nr:hypothetical protein [Sedimentisphaerales bacterium]
MPIFEYKCNNCGNKMDVLEKSNSKGKHVCEKCESSDMQRLFSGFSVGRGKQQSNVCPTGRCGLS